MNILGINFYGHDTSAAIVVDKRLIAAVEEERLSRIKHDRSFPLKAVEYCLREANLCMDDIDYIAISKDFKRLFTEKYLKYTIDSYPNANKLFLESFENMKYILNVENEMRDKLKYNGKIEYMHHHLCHFASSYYLSGFEEAALVSVDGLGEIESTVIGYGKGTELKMLENINYPHSLGMLYQSVTYYLGFTPNSDEGTVMALSSFGDCNEKLYNGSDSYIDIFRNMIRLNNSGYEIDLSYFNYPFTREGWVSEKFLKVFGPRRLREQPIEAHHKHIAAALQKRFEECYINIMNRGMQLTNAKNLALAGGCALNCVANGMIIEHCGYDDMYIQPAASDSGTAIGAALSLSYQITGGSLIARRENHTYYGPSFTDEEIEAALKRIDIRAKKLDNAPFHAAKLIKDGKIIGWFQGRMEFGPRALGNRSILAYPYPTSIKDKINNSIKHREPFRPFAPSVIKEHLNEYFYSNCDSPFMLLAYKSKEEKKEAIPAILHVDGTGRVQTVDRDTNSRYYELIRNFHDLTGLPIVLNTSFNDKGEPIVCSPDDALRTFKKTNLDALIIGDYLIESNAK